MTETPAVILNVDDNDAGRHVTSLLLRDAGFLVVEAADGTEALRAAAARPDLVLLDVQLPDLTGFEVCRRIKADPATATLPVLLISAAFVTADDRVHGLDEGADGYLSKPVEPAELVAQVRALLRLRRAEERALAAQCEAELMRSHLAAIVESSQDAIVSAALDYTVRTWNSGAERLFGYRADEIVGKSLTQIVPSDKRIDIPGLTDRLLQGEHIPALDTVRLRQDGRRVQVSLSPSPLKDAAGKVVGFSAIYRDITERTRLEEQYRQAQKMEAVGQLAGGVAHDFNNLLTIINGYGEILLSDLCPDDPARELIAEMTKAGGRAAALTRQLLAFSRRQIVVAVVLDLNAVVLDTERMLRRLIGEDIDLTTGLDPALGAVKADPGLMEQVVMNLAVNARDAMPQGGKLTIETRNVKLGQTYAELAPGPYILLAVSDTGHGMTAEVKARIFEPFFTTKGIGKGTGLGLATVYGIVKQAGGHVAVYSEPGVGTSFKVYLPRDQASARASRTDSTPRAAPRGSETVLLVEDEGALRALVRHTLQGSGYTVLDAANGREALEVAARHAGPISLLVTDVVMPELGGRRLAESLLRSRPAMQVLFLSGYTDDAVVRHGVLQAETNFLQKPFSPSVLASRVREILDQPSERRPQADGGPAGYAGPAVAGAI